MRRRQQVFYRINRIFLLLYAPLSIALSIYYLFTGSLLHSILSLFTLAWIFLPQMVHHLTHLRPGQLLLFFYCFLILFGYSGGLVLSFGTNIFLYDELIHSYSGFFFCLLAAALFCYLTKERANRINEKFCYIFSISFSFTAFFIWESLQLLMDIGLMKIQLTISDIVLDGFAWALGIGIMILCMFIQYHKQIHIYALYAFEDFSYLNVKSSIEIIK